MYFRVYCPECNSPKCRVQKGLRAWFSKVFLRRRIFFCPVCGYTFKRRRSSLSSLMRRNRNLEMLPYPHPNHFSNDKSAYLEGPRDRQPVADDTLAQLHMRTAARLAQATELIARSMQVMQEGQQQILSQQQEITRTQQNLADLLDGLNNFLKEADDKRLSPFTVVSQRLRNQAGAFDSTPGQAPSVSG